MTVRECAPRRRPRPSRTSRGPNRLRNFAARCRRGVLVTDAPSLPLAVAARVRRRVRPRSRGARVVTGAALDAAGGVPGLPANAVDALVSLARDPARWHAGAPLAAVRRPRSNPAPSSSSRASSPWTTTNPLGAAPSAAAAAANTSDVLVAGLVDAKPHAAAASPPAGVAPGSASRASEPAWTRGSSGGVEVEETKFSRRKRRAEEPARGSSAWKRLRRDDDALELMDEDARLDETRSARALRGRGGAGEGRTAGTVRRRRRRARIARWTRRRRGGGDGEKNSPPRRRRRSRARAGTEDLGDAFRCAGCPMLGQPASAAGSEQGHRRHGGRPAVRGDFFKNTARDETKRPRPRRIYTSSLLSKGVSVVMRKRATAFALRTTSAPRPEPSLVVRPDVPPPRPPYRASRSDVVPDDPRQAQAAAAPTPRARVVVHLEHHGGLVELYPHGHECDLADAVPGHIRVSPPPHASVEGDEHPSAVAARASPYATNWRRISWSSGASRSLGDGESSKTRAKNASSRSSAASSGANTVTSPATSWKTPPGTTMDSRPLRFATARKIRRRG